MTSAEAAPSTTYHLDFDQVKNVFDRVRTEIDQCNYGQAVEFASVAIRRIQQLVLSIVLKHRAYARGMQGKFDEAIEDVKCIISYQPTLAANYLQLGNLYQMQGKQLCAIDTFKKGLRWVSADSSVYTLLMDGKEVATKQSESCVDFLAKLPLEIADDIISLLSRKDKAACVNVSTVWRTKVLGCSKAWNTLTVGDHTAGDPLEKLLPFIAVHVEHLTMATSNELVWKSYLFGMRNKKFRKIQSLELTQSAMRYITMDVVTPVRHAFHWLNATLTKIVLSHNMEQAIITLSDLLYGLSNLRCLVYKTTRRWSESVGSFPLPIPHDALVDLQLSAQLITENTLVPVLQHCSQIRRLVIDGCNTDVLDAIDANNCPNLVILGYNSSTSPTPPLDRSDIEQNCSGLEKFYTMNHGDRQSATVILSLIRRNMKSLKEIYSNVSARECDDLLTTYADMSLDKIEKLVFWGYDSTVIQPLLLRSISSTTTLSHLSVMVSYDMPRLANTLCSIPSLSSLSLSHIAATSASKDLVALFKTYATDNQSKRTIKSIRLSYSNAVTDDVLAALSRIHSLRDIGLTGIRNVSADGIDIFFRSLSDKNVAYISFDEMDVIMDDGLTALSAVKSLKHVCLTSLPVTSRGIIAIVDQLPSLCSLTLGHCDRVNESAILYGKRKIRNVIVNGRPI